MHGMIGRNAITPAIDDGAGWEPYIPWFFERRKIRNLIGLFTLYVMRREREGLTEFRACTARELSSIEARDVASMQK